MKYRKKPVVVEAIQWNGVNLQEIIDFVGNKLEYHICDTAWEVGKGRPQVTMKIKTLEGEHIATEGDYIIKGVHVEFYPCKPDIFKKTYEPATNTHYDRIKAMSVEEMAEMLLEKMEKTMSYCNFCEHYKFYAPHCSATDIKQGCLGAVKKYLESEVQEE